MRLEQIKELGGFVYLATPYSKFPKGRFMAYVEACRAAGDLMQTGVSVFSPIAHTHGIAEACDMDPVSHDIWIPLDEALMAAASAIIVVLMEGWADSGGVAIEIVAFRKAGKPVFFYDPATGMMNA